MLKSNCYGKTIRTNRCVLTTMQLLKQDQLEETGVE